MGLMGLFGKKEGSAAEEALQGKYAALGKEANAEISKFSGAVGKDWQVTANHRNFDRSPFELQVKMFLEKHERELFSGKYIQLAALVKDKVLNFNDVAFDAMGKAVVRIGGGKLLDAFEKNGRKLS